MKQLKDYLHLYYGCDVIGVKSKQIVRLGTIDKVVIELSEQGLIKLILRSLSSMTEEEEAKSGPMPETVFEAAQQVSFLLSKHFDLFGLIEAGLAIDQRQHEI